MTAGSDMALPSPDLVLRCECGHVRGIASGVSPSTGFRVLCYCKDCQAFARFLGRADVPDAVGGTDIFQMPLAHVKLTAGTDAVRCLRLSERGVLRWYTACCHTPIGNTAASPRVPLIGVVLCFMDHRGHSPDVILGPPVCRIYERSAIGPLPPTAPAPPSLGVLFRRASRMFGWWMRGLARPSSFFDDRTNAPCCVPRTLTPRERAAL